MAYLQNCRAVLSHVIDYGAAAFERIAKILTVHEQTWDAVVLALRKHVAVRGYVWSECVNRTPIVDHDEYQRQFLFGSCIEALCHASVLRATFTHEHDSHAIIVSVLLGL